MLTDDSFSDVKEFAKWMLRDGRLTLGLRPDLIKFDSRNVAEVVLFREACWQAELIVIPPNTFVPAHSHSRVDSCELALSGEIDAVIGGHSFPRELQRGAMRNKLVRVPAGIKHGALVPDTGFAWISFQRWTGGEVGWISEDWQE